MVDDIDDDPFVDLDETHRLLMKQAEGAVIDLSISPTGRLNLAGDGAEAHKLRIDAGRMNGHMNITQGVNVEEADDLTFQGAVFSHGIQEDGSIISVKNIGGVVTSHIEVAPSVEEENPEFLLLEPTEPKLSFSPFLWVGLRYIRGGVRKTPEDSNDTGRQTIPHLVVWEPADGDKNDGANGEDSHNIISNRDDLLQQRTFSSGTKIWTLHGDQASNAEDLLKKSAAYPLGPNKSDTLEMWSAPTDPSTIPDNDGKDDWEVIIRSKRHNKDTVPITSRSGVGSVHARAGDYYIKLFLYHHRYEDWKNLTDTEFELEVWVGRGTGEVLTRKYEIIHQQSSGYLMGALPKGWYPKINTFFPSATESCNACAVNIADYGTNAHGGAWWPKGVRVTMPPEQQSIPVTLFAKPEAWKPIDDLIPPVGFGSVIPKISIGAGGANVASAVPPIKLGVWPDRILRSGGCNQTASLYTRISIQIVNGLISFSGSQVKIRTDAAIGCPTTPPSVIAWSNFFEGEPNQLKMFGLNFYAGTYWTQDGQNSVILHPGDLNNGTQQIWQEGSCFAATMDVIQTIVLPWGPSIQALIDTEINPILRPVTMYLKTTTSTAGTSGTDYGPGQKPTIYDSGSSTVVSSEEEWTGAGGPGGLFSAQFSPDTACSRILESF